MTKRHVLVYGHLNLNLLDGSATWLTSLVETLTQTNSVVHLLLRAPVQTERLLSRVASLPDVHVHESIPRDQGGLLTSAQAIARLEDLARTHDARALIVRGREFTAEVATSDVLAPILWGYVTDLSFPATDMPGEELEQMRRIATRGRRLFLQTEETRSYIEGIIPEAAGKTLLMTPTVPDSLFLPLDDKEPSDELRLIYAGKFHPHWRTLEMLDLPRLLGEAGVPARLTMLGDKFQVPGQWTDDMRAGLLESRGVTWGGGVSREEVVEELATHDVGLSWRTRDLDNSLELSTKLLEYAAAGTPPVPNRTRAHEELLGADYPLMLDDDSVETLVTVLGGAREHLPSIRAAAQDAARRYSSTVTAQRLEDYLQRAEPGFATHPIRPDTTSVLLVDAEEGEFTRLLDARPDVGVARTAAEDEWPEADVVVVGPRVDPEAAARRLGTGQRLVHWDDVAAVPHGVDTADFSRPSAPDARFNLSLASLVPFDARPDRAVDVMQRLVVADHRFHLYVRDELPWDRPDVWADPEQQERYRSLLRRIELDDELAAHITFLPPAADIANQLREIGWMLCTGDGPTDPIPTRQAMAAGTVPARFDDHGSAEALAAHIADTVRDDERWSALVASTRAEALAYDLPIVQGQLLDLVLGRS